MTLDTYSHVLPDMQQAATDKLEMMLYRKFDLSLSFGTPNERDKSKYLP